MTGNSSHEDEAMKRQCGSQEEEALVMQRCKDPDEAVVMQRSGGEAKECPRLDHPGQNKKEWPKHDASNNRCKKTRRPGLDHREQNKQQ